MRLGPPGPAFLNLNLDLAVREIAMRVQAIPSQYVDLKAPSSVEKLPEEKDEPTMKVAFERSLEEVLSRKERGALEKAFGVKWAAGAEGYHPSGTMRSGGDGLLGRRLDVRG